MASSRSIAWRWLILIIAAVLFADQLSKHAIEKYTSMDYLHTIIPGLLNFTHTYNPGVAFSLFADSHSPIVRLFLVFFSVVVIFFLGWLLAAERAGGRMGQIGMAMILGGAIGNVLDRFMRKGVTDFIDFHIFSHHWPTFNVADSSIVIGAALVLWELFRDLGSSSKSQGA